MTTQNIGLWRTIAALSIGLSLGVGTTAWLTQPSPSLASQVHADPQHDHQLAKLERVATALTQALHLKQTNDTSPKSTQVIMEAPDESSRQALAQLIREEVRQAVADANPEAQRARDEALVEAEILASPENRAAYQSVSDVVHTAVAAKRWSEEDKEIFHAAFGLLTNTQRMELMDMLFSSINSGEVKVEVNGPLF